MKKQYWTHVSLVVTECSRPSGCLRKEHITLTNLTDLTRSTGHSEERVLDLHVRVDWVLRALDATRIVFRPSGLAVAERAILEAFESPPSAEAVAQSVAAQHASTVRALAIPVMWLLPGQSEDVADRKMQAPTSPRELPELHTLSKGRRVESYKISRLSKVQGSLRLRHIGDGTTLQNALRQLVDVCRDARHAQELHEEMGGRLFEHFDKFHDELKLEGRLVGERNALCLVSATRKLALTTDELARINGCDDPLALQGWLQNAAVATSSAEVFADRSAQTDAEQLANLAQDMLDKERWFICLRKTLRLAMATRKLALTIDENARIEACGDENTLKCWLHNAVTTASTSVEVFAERTAQPDAE